MGQKILGAGLLVAALILRYQFTRARRRGYVGSRRRPITRERHRTRFHLTLTGHALGALICFIAAFLCLTGAIHRG